MVPAAQLLASTFITSLIHQVFLREAPRVRRWPASCDEKQEACLSFVAANERHES
jgi:hypothetical protein